MGDYHGFVPFIGTSVGYEQWRFREIDGEEVFPLVTQTGFRPGITFGWDIRPDEVQSFILRTNLRYTPFRLNTAGDTLFSFISLNSTSFSSSSTRAELPQRRGYLRGKG